MARRRDRGRRLRRSLRGDERGRAGRRRGGRARGPADGSRRRRARAAPAVPGCVGPERSPGGAGAGQVPRRRAGRLPRPAHVAGLDAAPPRRRPSRGPRGAGPGDHPAARSAALGAGPAGAATAPHRPRRGGDAHRPPQRCASSSPSWPGAAASTAARWWWRPRTSRTCSAATRARWSRATARWCSAAATGPSRSAAMEHAFGLTEDQRRRLERAPRGEFLLLAGSRRGMIQVDLPEAYRAMICR